MGQDLNSTTAVLTSSMSASVCGSYSPLLERSGGFCTDLARCNGLYTRVLTTLGSTLSRTLAQGWKTPRYRAHRARTRFLWDVLAGPTLRLPWAGLTVAFRSDHVPAFWRLFDSPLFLRHATSKFHLTAGKLSSSTISGLSSSDQKLRVPSRTSTRLLLSVICESPRSRLSARR